MSHRYHSFTEDAPSHRFFMYYLAIELGIAPAEPDSGNMNLAMKNMPPIESKAMKRKFRKMWRRIEAGGYKPASYYAESLRPRMRGNKWYRKMAVWATLYWESATLLEKVKQESVNLVEEAVE